MGQIQQNIEDILADIQRIGNQEVDVLAVTKYASLQQTEAIVSSGLIQMCGENKVQNGIIKTAAFPNMRWEFIGHLQTNKVRKAVENFDRIQSVDSLTLAQRIGQIKSDHDPVDILIQVNGGEEPHKYGFSIADLDQVKTELFELKGVNIKGLMIVAPFTQETQALHKIFKKSRQVFENWRQHSKLVDTLSMGMSHDYRIAIEEGSTMVRIGSLILEGGNT